MSEDLSESQPNEEVLPYLAQAISTFGQVYNGFEAHGMEHVPREGPALLVFYHGLNPLDAWYFGMKYYLETGRLIRGLGDRWLFKTPGLKQLCRSVGAIPGEPEAALRILKEGHLVGVSPGGVREAIAGTAKNYQLLWGKRTGFAKLALEAQVPLIPAFTENVEEMYRAPFAGTKFIQGLYERTRLPLVPIVGLGILPFPVKLRSWLGEPIHPVAGETPEELATRTGAAITGLIDKHQKNPRQGVVEALKKRFF